MRLRSNNQRGVTLTELMVVLAIIAVGSAIAVPTYVSYLPLLKIRAATRGLISDIRFTRQLAVSSNRKHRLNFSSATLYEVQRDESSSQNWTSTKTVKTVDMDKAYSKIHWTSIAEPTVYFLPNGGVDTSATRNNNVTAVNPLQLELSHTQETDYRIININLAGRVWTE